MTTRTFDTLLASYSPGVQQVARTARKLLLDMLPGGRESVDPSAPVVGYGYGAGYKGLICTLILSKSGVKLGVIRGAELPDPNGLLEGSGKKHRYVALETPSDLRKAGLKPLVKSAVTAWRARNA